MSESVQTPDEHIAAPALSRQRLLPFNRRLRHLQGITVRNLSFSQTPQKARSQTIDDEGIPSSKKSPTKSLALRETKSLEHSRSFSDLRANGSIISPLPNGSPKGKSKEGLPQRPGKGRMRRRSTLDWTGASPLARQQKLEDVAVERMMDSFFSLHVEGVDDPIYISENVENAMNPSFRHFDLNDSGPAVTRLDTVTARLWARTKQMQNYQLLIEYDAQLSYLQFVAKTLENFRHPLPSNCVIFHLSDGIYTSFIDIPADFRIPKRPAKNAEGSSEQTFPTSSYDALMKLSTLDDCIQDALMTQQKLAEDIQGILEKNSDSLNLINGVPEAVQQAKSAEQAVTTMRRRVAASRKQRDEMQSSLKSRKQAIQRGREDEASASNDMEEAKPKLDNDKQTCKTLGEVMVGQRRRVCEELQSIYPIEPIKARSLAFTIRGIYLPNSEFNNCNEVEIAAALGYVAQMVQQLSIYLAVPLPYPVQPRGSTSTVEDPVSIVTGPRMYPLFIKGTIRYRFEYGVFLLNKNIEILSGWLGLRLLDIRQTLPNLKYLLYIATAGKGDLPVRKSGGIRGLMQHFEPLKKQQEDEMKPNGGKRYSKPELTANTKLQPPDALKLNGALKSPLSPPTQTFKRNSSLG